MASTQQASTSTKDMHLTRVLNLLKKRLGMTQSAAGTLAYKWHTTRDDTKLAVASTFMHQAIHNHINAYRAQSFAKFGLDVNLYPSKGASTFKMPLSDFQDGWLHIGYSKYTFQIGDVALDMHVCPDQGTILVGFCGDFRPISEFLDEFTPQNDAPFNSQMAYRAQSDWWRINGKTFNLQGLPGELRNAIYGLVLGSVALPYSKHKARHGRRTPRTETAIMRLNKQVYLEASHQFYTTSTFLLEQGAVAKKLLHNNRLRVQLRDITLALTHSGFLDLFHFDLSSADTPTYALRTLRDTDLSRLQIHIGAPSRVSENFYLEGACQKAVIERIFAAAWPSIKGHPVIITGYIKDSQKSGILAQLDKARQDFVEWSASNSIEDVKAPSLREYDEFMRESSDESTGGVRLDEGEERIEDSYAEPSFITTHSLDCLCEPVCKKKGWTSRG